MPDAVSRPRAVTIGIVAGEASGDALAATLIHAVRARLPAARFVGIAGPPLSGLMNCIFQPWQASGSPYFASAASISRLRA